MLIGELLWEFVYVAGDFLGIKRQIFFSSSGGFDSHNAQLNGTDATQGTHAALLVQLSGAMKALKDTNSTKVAI